MMVNIYLPIDNRPVLALSIPSDDIERLSIRPVKWLRFVTFAICGVRGHLSAMPNGPPVDYDSISLEHIAEAYYYIPDGEYHLIDHNAMNNQMTSSEQTPRASSFRSDVMARDGPVCVFTGVRSVGCDAAHLLAKSKGDEYIEFIFQDRRNSYNPAPEVITSIDAVENGILLRKDLHAMSAVGEDAFLKTPNFALDTADIPRVETGPLPPSRITLHHLKPDTSYDPIPQRDARFVGTGTSLPSTVILDFTYGVAAYKRWGSGQDIKEVMQRRFATAYEPIPRPPASSHSSDSDDDPNDNDYITKRRRNHSPKRSDGMLRAMDDVLMLSMLLKGTTPELMAEERQRQEDAEELRAKEASRVKVEQWIQSSPDVELQSDAASGHQENLPP